MSASYLKYSNVHIAHSTSRLCGSFIICVIGNAAKPQSASTESSPRHDQGKVHKVYLIRSIRNHGPTLFVLRSIANGRADGKVISCLSLNAERFLHDGITKQSQPE